MARRTSGVFVNWMSRVLDDLDQVAPRVAEVEAAAGHDVRTGRLERRPHGLLVVDHEPEVAVGVGLLAAALGEGDELVARVDEGHAGDAAAQAQLEDLTVEGERLVEVADLEGDMVDADEAGGHARASAQPPMGAVERGRRGVALGVGTSASLARRARAAACSASW